MSEATTAIPAAVASTPFNPFTLSAKDLHKTLLRTFRLGNQARYKFNLGLLAMERGGLYSKLGASSIHAYASKHFFMSPTQTKEALRAAKALRTLPQSRGAFNRGELSWSHILELTRVAEKDTEERWLDHARTHTVFQHRAEVRDAQEKNRKVPRDDGYGLPAIHLPLSFQLTLEEHDLLEKAFAKVGREMGGALGAEDAAIPPKEVLLFMARRFLETDPEGTPKGRTEREESIYNLLLQWCPGCKAAHVHTSQGPAEVPVDHVLRVVADARKVLIRPEEEAEVKGEARAPGEIDGPNTASIVRKVLARDGNRCANPHCKRRLGLHAHHIVFRSQGGPTALYNLVAVCSRCHACVHASLLDVYRDAQGELRWMTRAEEITLDPEPEVQELRAVPEVVLPEEPSTPEAPEGPAAAASLRVDDLPPSQPAPECFFVDEEGGEKGSTAAGPASTPEGISAPTVRRQTTPESQPSARRRTEGPTISKRVLELCASGLRRLGHEKADALEMVRDAWRRLQERGTRFGMQELLSAALGFPIDPPEVRIRA